MSPDRISRSKLYCNRSLAYLKALRSSEALEDAESAIQCNPNWGKAHWRRGAALKEVERVPEAVSAFHRAWQLSKGTLPFCAIPPHNSLYQQSVL